tara:strand:- start:294 stop:440 length:147 start_codon:yes stop_codon:yes gene_type:complete
VVVLTTLDAVVTVTRHHSDHIVLLVAVLEQTVVKDVQVVSEVTVLEDR